MQHTHYWSYSKIGDIIRGTPKPISETSEGWDAWDARAKQAHPFRYWIVEEVFDIVQDAIGYIPQKFDSARQYLDNRFITRSNSLTASPKDIPPGIWCDVGYRFLPCLFNELKNFVEIEKAWMNVICDTEAQRNHNVHWRILHRWARFFLTPRWRSAEAGLEHLDWEISLTRDESYGLTPDDPQYNTPSEQSTSAAEIKALYLWWTQEYPNRPDPHDLSGWTEWYETKYPNGLFDNPTPTLPIWREDTVKSTEVLNKLMEIEAKYDAEDEAMLYRLIKIRHSLWT